MDEIALPDLIISSELIERILFSVSSRNAEAKVCECAAHVFASPYSDDPNGIKWQYVSSGVACILRNRELSSNGRRYVWSISLCLYNASYGVLVWKGKLLHNADYTAVADNFHVFALGEVNVLVGIMFSNKDKACELNTTYNTWNQERARDDGKKGYIAPGQSSEPARFRKDMISKPCNFQHIQGTQAIDECMDIEKIKSDIIATFFGMGTEAGRAESDSKGSQVQEKPAKSRKKKKEPVKPRLEFREISLPHAHQGAPVSSPLSPGEAFVPGNMEYQPQEGMVQADINGYPQGEGMEASYGQDPVPLGDGYNPAAAAQDSNGVPNNVPVEVKEQEFSNFSKGSSERASLRRGDQVRSPNYQNPISPDYQEYNTSQGSYSNEVLPPRIDLSLEKEFSESALFKPSIMTAN